MKRAKAVVLLSGGIDSAVVLWWARNRGEPLATLTFLFPGRRKMELAATRKLRGLAGCRLNYEVNLPFVDAPKSSESCYIPKRNLMYYGIAASLAEKLGAGYVLGGHIRHDGAVFPDARKTYLDKVDRLVRVRGRSGGATRLLFPFLRADKKKIISAGAGLGVPFAATWSCSNDGRRHCWKCKSCDERRQGFRSAGLQDPLAKE